jgi:hypothetical protein
MVNYQIQYIRQRASLPMTRDYMAEAGADLRALMPEARSRMAPSDV